MDNGKVMGLDAQLQAKQAKFDDDAVKSFWSENGELIYVMKEGTDLVEYGDLLKDSLETKGVFEHSTNVKLTHEDQTHFQVFVVGEDSESFHNGLRRVQED